MFAFLLTYKHVPFIYYGDEIGMTHAWGINKDGGYIRTGCRTPMQWTNGQNRGFSTANSEDLYLPVNGVEAQSVESMQSREASLLNTVKKLTALRHEHPALFADAEQKIVLCENGGYPLVFERTDGKETICVAINPSATSAKVTLSGEVLLSQNCQFDGDTITLTGKSFVILKK